MADHSAIEWTDTTWNPVTGCDRVSPGCAHCYFKQWGGSKPTSGGRELDGRTWDEFPEVPQ